MDMTHGTGTFARRYQRVLFLILLAEADTADLLLLRQLCFLHEDEFLCMRLLLLQRPLLPLLCNPRIRIDGSSGALFSRVDSAHGAGTLGIRRHVNLRCDGSLRRIEPKRAGPHVRIITLR